MSSEDRRRLLVNAQKVVCEERNDQYGEPEESLARIAAYWSIYLNIRVTPKGVADMMELLKIARSEAQPFYMDNYIDRIGYAAIAGELALCEQRQDIEEK